MGVVVHTHAQEQRMCLEKSPSKLERGGVVGAGGEDCYPIDLPCVIEHRAADIRRGASLLAGACDNKETTETLPE